MLFEYVWWNCLMLSNKKDLPIRMRTFTSVKHLHGICFKPEDIILSKLLPEAKVNF